MGGILTWESFQSWADNPVRTTTRTLPMSEIKFPKVTVCPPKNTFTDLNYDLIIAENVSLADKTKNELYENITELIDENVYMDLLDKVQEEDRFYNWYFGLTFIAGGPRYMEIGEYDYQCFIVTSAPSGVIATQYFGEDFNPNLIDKSYNYYVDLHPARNISLNENVTLHVKIEKQSMTKLIAGKDEIYFNSNEYFKSDITTNFRETFTPPGRSRTFSTERKVSDIDIREMDTDDKMPGFRLSWYYTGMEFNPDPVVKSSEFLKNMPPGYDKFNNVFVR